MTPGDDPFGRRALFAPPSGAASASRSDGNVRGRRAFFSDQASAADPPTPAPASGDRAPATVRVICRSCRQATDLAPTRAARALLGSLWWPLGAWNHRMRCPACGRVGWCRVEWDGLIDWR